MEDMPNFTPLPLNPFIEMDPNLLVGGAYRMNIMVDGMQTLGMPIMYTGSPTSFTVGTGPKNDKNGTPSHVHIPNDPRHETIGSHHAFIVIDGPHLKIQCGDLHGMTVYDATDHVLGNPTRLSSGDSHDYFFVNKRNILNVDLPTAEPIVKLELKPLDTLKSNE